jgi:hypothetical protein
MFAARALVQLSLFRDNKTGWLAFTKIVMGFPLYLVVVGVVFWVVRRGRQRLPVAAEPSSADGHEPTGASSLPLDSGQRPSGADKLPLGGADRAPDRGLGLGQRDE